MRRTIGTAARRALWIIGAACIAGGAGLAGAVHLADAVEDSKYSPPTELQAVGGPSASDLWAVGYNDFGEGVLLLHWDGQHWSPVASHIGPGAKLFALSALSASDAWAVGTYSPPHAHRPQTLVLHWDGLSWKRVASPDPSAFLNVLYGVSAVSAGDAWAAGYSLTYSHHFHSLLLHWNGTRWSYVPVPGPELDAVTAISSKNAWAMGLQVLLHWNGVRWSKQSIHTHNALQAVRGVRLLSASAISAKDVWAVGQRCAHFGPCVARTDVIHWNGRRWSPVASPAPTHWFNTLNSVQALSANDVWAAGSYCQSSSCRPEHTLIMHWNGTRWSTVPSPTGGSPISTLGGIGGPSSSSLWAVGAAGKSSGTNPLRLQWTGNHWVPS